MDHTTWAVWRQNCYSSVVFPHTGVHWPQWASIVLVEAWILPPSLFFWGEVYFISSINNIKNQQCNFCFWNFRLVLLKTLQKSVTVLHSVCIKTNKIRVLTVLVEYISDLFVWWVFSFTLMWRADVSTYPIVMMASLFWQLLVQMAILSPLGRTLTTAPHTSSLASSNDSPTKHRSCRTHKMR